MLRPWGQVSILPQHRDTVTSDHHVMHRRPHREVLTGRNLALIRYSRCARHGSTRLDAGASSFASASQYPNAVAMPIMLRTVHALCKSQRAMAATKYVEAGAPPRHPRHPCPLPGPSAPLSKQGWWFWSDAVRDSVVAPLQMLALENRLVAVSPQAPAAPAWIAFASQCIWRCRGCNCFPASSARSGWCRR